MQDWQSQRKNRIPRRKYRQPDRGSAQIRRATDAPDPAMGLPASHRPSSLNQFYRYQDAIWRSQTVSLRD